MTHPTTLLLEPATLELYTVQSTLPQVLCTVIAFTIRYPLAYLLFGEVVA